MTIFSEIVSDFIWYITRIVNYIAYHITVLFNRIFTMKYKFRILHHARTPFGDVYIIQYKRHQFDWWHTLKGTHGVSLYDGKETKYVNLYTREDAEQAVSNFISNGYNHFRNYLKTKIVISSTDTPYVCKEFAWSQRCYTD